jgi:hypothetical protein
MSWDTPQRPPFPAAAQKLTISGVAALSNVIGASACMLCASTDVHFLVGGAPVATTADSFLPAHPSALRWPRAHPTLRSDRMIEASLGVNLEGSCRTM